MKRLLSFLQITYLWILLLPIALGFLGASSNQLVLIANHDKFPVMLSDAKIEKLNAPQPSQESPFAPGGIQISKYSNADVMIDEVHCVMTSKTHLNFLADIFDFKDAIYSIGDLLLEAGSSLWTFCPFVWGAFVIRKLRY